MLCSRRTPLKRQPQGGCHVSDPASRDAEAPLPLSSCQAIRPLAAVLAVSLFVAGCASEAEIRAAEEAQAAADRQQCSDLGFQPGTEGFADCLLKLREIRAMERSAGGLGVSLGVGMGF